MCDDRVEMVSMGGLSKYCADVVMCDGIFS